MWLFLDPLCSGVLASGMVFVLWLRWTTRNNRFILLDGIDVAKFIMDATTLWNVSFVILNLMVKPTNLGVSARLTRLTSALLPIHTVRKLFHEIVRALLTSGTVCVWSGQRGFRLMNERLHKFGAGYKERRGKWSISC